MAGGRKWGRLPLVGLVLAAIIGILLAEWHPLELFMAGTLTLASLVLWCVTRKTVSLWLLSLVAFQLLHSLQFQNNPGRELAKTLGSGRILMRGEGIVDSAPIEKITGRNDRVVSSFEVKMTRSELQLPEGWHLMISWPGPAPEYGSKIRFEGTLTNELPPRNPGEFDYAGWLVRRQIFSTVRVRNPADGSVIAPGSPWALPALAIRSRIWMESRMSLDLGTEPEVAGVIKAMVLGTTSENLDELKLQMQQTGTLHLFAVSGLQVTILAAMIMFALQTVRVPRRTAVLLTIPLILFYALVTGWGASSVRAAIMTSLFLGAILLDRPTLTFNTLAASALLILAADTNQLFSTGFQLSYSVVIALLLLADPISRFLEKPGRPDPFIPLKLLPAWRKVGWSAFRFCAATLGITLAAWLGSLPLTACYFNLLSPVALLANLVIVPWSFVVLLLGILSVLASVTGAWLPMFFNNANWAAVKGLWWMVQLFASLPGGHLHIGGHWLESNHECRVEVLDQAAGGAIVVETPQSCWLIDTGSEMGYQRITRAYLQKRGINRIDGIILTHADGDHIGGIDNARKDFPKATVYLPAVDWRSPVFRRWNMWSGKGLKRGDTLKLAPFISLDILYPGAHSDSGRADDKALVIQIKAYGKTMLLTSDSGFSTETELLGESSLAADVLVRGRHRSDPANSTDFLDAVHPKALICTAATIPKTEQVPRAWISWCAARQSSLFRQDETGAVEIRISPGGGELQGFLNGARLRLGK